MFNYIVKKVAYGLLVMLGVITLIFVLFNLLPGDPARMMLGQNADRESIEILHKELGLDKPVYVQYFNYLNDLSPIGFDKDGSFGFKTPDLRRSYQSGRSVSSILADSFPNTTCSGQHSFCLCCGSVVGGFGGNIQRHMV